MRQRVRVPTGTNQEETKDATTNNFVEHLMRGQGSVVRIALNFVKMILDPETYGLALKTCDMQDKVLIQPLLTYDRPLDWSLAALSI